MTGEVGLGNQSTVTQATTNFLGQYVQQSDLDKFFTLYAPEAKITHPAAIVGSNVNSDPGVEAMLDSEYVMREHTHTNIPTPKSPRAPCSISPRQLLGYILLFSRKPCRHLYRISFGTTMAHVLTCVMLCAFGVLYSYRTCPIVFFSRRFIMGVGRDISTLWYFTAGKQPGDPGDEPWLAWLTALANETRLPMVFSGSYTDYELHVTYVTVPVTRSHTQSHVLSMYSSMI